MQFSADSVSSFIGQDRYSYSCEYKKKTRSEEGSDD